MFFPIPEFTEEQRQLGYRYLENEYPERTLCQILREIHQLANHPQISERCCEAIYRAKRMNEALKTYREQVDQPGGCGGTCRKRAVENERSTGSQP